MAKRRSGWAGKWDRHVWDMPAARARRRAGRMREGRIALWSGLLGGLLLFNASQLSGRSASIDASGTSVPAPNTYGGAVRVIDGDTFDYSGERIRISDIDTPELRARCAEEAVLARRATDRLRVMLAEGPFELKRLGRDEDRYGRKLRLVLRGGRSIGDRLVAEGLARTWTGRREPWC